MSPGSNTALSDYRMEKARESIKAARIMLNEKMLTFAMNRIYYAMFYAVQAALSKKGVSFSKHSQVKGYFNREFIKSGALPMDMGRLYNKAFEYRQKFDYVDFAVPDKDMIIEYVENADQFVNDIDAYLKS
jgi:uncharacterized protein (UPF0332 family)